MKTIFTFIVFFFTIITYSQTTLSGRVVDEKGNPISGANIFIEGSYDGTSSNDKGEFTFVTNLKGNHTLVISSLIYEISKTIIDVSDFKNKVIKLRESVTSLDAVIITAGNLEAGDKARVSVLKPLDIVTTAGSVGDIVAALQTLPGTQNVSENGRLFVRGGEANETQTFIDGIRVAQPYGASTENLPTRGRFSPFLFSGISFSTGGYSAEYGEALSSVLLLNTQDEPDQNKTDIGLMTVGLGVGNTQKWNKSSLSMNANYINLAPYQSVIPQNVSWNTSFQSLSGESVYRYNFNNGILKVYAAFDSSQFDVNQTNINFPLTSRVDLDNTNFYSNASYKGNFLGNWQITSGLSYGYSKNNINIDLDKVTNSENAAHLKLKLKKSISDRFKIAFGSDYFITKFDEDFKQRYNVIGNSGYDSSIAAIYTEADVFFSKKMVTKVGIRAAINELLQETTFSPRVSLAYKIAKSSQLSFAYGDFNQTPSVDYIKYSKFHQFESEKAQHYIFNYQYNRENKTLRAEVYYKNYDNLVKYEGDVPQFNSVYSNKGYGFAKGLDLFWRDGKTIQNLEYWVSYSFIDTQRDYKNFPIQATPNFVANHSLSIVTKYWITDWKSQIGFTNTFSSGRPYNNPNESKFMNGMTKSYNSLSFNWAYLLTSQKILYLSISNVLGTKNVFGYKYSASPDSNGFFDRTEIQPTADQFFFVGYFWTISKNKKDNQLKNL